MADTQTTQIAQLQAALRNTNAQIAALQTAQSSSLIMTPSQSVYFIPPQTVVSSSGAVVNWTTFSTPYIPADAVAILLDGYFMNSSGSTSWSYFYVRQSASDTTGLFLGATVSGAGGDTSSYGGQGWFPASSGTIQYSTNNNHFSFMVRAIGYFGNAN